MKIINGPLLATYRSKRCAWCGQMPPSDAAHIYAKGFGGGYQLDIAINLLPLCRPCHNLHHDGHEPTRFSLVTLVAGRLGERQDDITRALMFLQRMTKNWSPDRIETELAEMVQSYQAIEADLMKVGLQWTTQPAVGMSPAATKLVRKQLER